MIFTRAFFYNFRLFTNPADFIRLLKDRFTLKPPTEPAPLPDDQLTFWTNRVLIPIRLRVYNVIKTWLETYFSFEQDSSVEQSLVDFASNEMSKAMPGPAKRMTELITRTVSFLMLKYKKYEINHVLCSLVCIKRIKLRWS